MNWRSTAVVTGATALVGWLASPPPRTPAASLAVRPTSASQPPLMSDIEQQATRLQSRLRAEATFREPSRDPFRFEERRAPLLPSTAPDPAETPDTTPVSRGPLLALSGLATDVVGGITQRTAILSAPDGVLLVREGDTVSGLYRVATIEDDAVDLVRIGDGERLRLRLAAAAPRP